nr:ABC transporter G family member 21-like [Hydra vulgaris]
MYRLSAYYTAKNVVDLPVMILPHVILYTIIYWSAGLNCSPVFLLRIFTVILTTALSQSIGLVIGVSIKDFKKTSTVAVIFFLSNLLLGGFYSKRFPPWFKWSKYISVYSYIYNIFLRIEFEYAKEEFKCSTISEFRECRNNNRTHMTGPELMAYIKPIDLDIMQSVFVIFGLSIVLRILFYFVLKYLNKGN